jgi:hypothetical protein
MDPSSPTPKPRGALPDAETPARVHLVKNVATLRATYQIRLLAFLAAQKGKKLVLHVPAACRFEADLEELRMARPEVIEREDLP